jgi:phospholipid-translocating ATPase
MFHHNRSTSDVSLSGDPYEPTVPPIISRSPSRSPVPNYMDAPPMSQANTQETKLLPNPHNAGHLTPSPTDRIPSYYSASDLPAPSPMPDPIYKYPTGEITTTPPSPRTSVMSKTSPRRGHAPMPSTSSSQFAQPPYDPLQLPERSHNHHPELFEMHVRGPSDDLGTPYGHAFERSASSQSYATAVDSYHSADDGPPRPPLSHYDNRHAPHASPEQGWSSEDDHATVVGSHSIDPSWEGPRAL